MDKIYSKNLLLLAFLSFAILPSAMAQKEGKIKTMGVEKFHKTLIKAKNPQLIDVRSPEEYEDGHLNGSVNYNISDSTLSENLDKLNKKKPVFVYCRFGVRSQQAADLLKEHGFKVYNLSGGITDWKAKGFPTSQTDY